MRSWGRVGPTLAGALGALLAPALVPFDTPATAQVASMAPDQPQLNLWLGFSQSQTFQAARSGNLGTLGIALARRPFTPTTANIIIQIRSTSAGEPAQTRAPGAVLAQTTVMASAIPVISPGPIPFTTVTFTPPPMLSAGALYAITMSTAAPQVDTSDRPTGLRVGAERRTSDPLSKAFFSVDLGATWFAQDYSLLFQTSAAVQPATARSPSAAPPLGSGVDATTSPITQPRSATTASDPVIAAAGDIACDPADANFNGGAGVTGSFCRMQATSDVMVGANLAAVLPVGDEQYETGLLSGFQQSYDHSWGRVKTTSRPVPGNHEYESAGAGGYYAYFGAAAGDPAKGYYSFDIGSWHLIALNANCGSFGWDANGCAAGSPQEQWLRADLANSHTCTLAFWHEPRWASGFASDVTYDAFWRALYAAHVDVVVNGHQHFYERFAPQNPDGVADSTAGIREFVVGSGGQSHFSFQGRAANSEIINVDTFGVLELTLHSGGYDWQLAPGDGAFTDSGTGLCHQATPAPTVSGISPSSGPAAGGTVVTISGTGFSTLAGGTTVSFGPNPGATVTCSSATQCSATSPAGSGTVDVGVTVSGQTSAASTADQFTYSSSGGAPLTVLAQPLRLVDTRSSGGAIAAGASRCFVVTGQLGGIPGGAAAAVLNVTAVGYGANGWLTVYPNGQSVPATSTVNFDVHENAIANGALVKVGTGGQVCVNAGNTSSNVIIDASGYETP
jgi:acid phosphatase type 7